MGEEVLTTPLTCFATTAAIRNSGLRASWVDVDPKTGNMDLDDLAGKLQPHHKLIMIVHFAGNPVDLYRLEEILDAFEMKHGFRPWVIEDCAHAFGSEYIERSHSPDFDYSQRVSLGGHDISNIRCFSFQAVKTLTTIEGGLLVIPEPLYERAKKLRWFGYDRKIPIYKQDISEVGFKYNLNDVHASIGIANLKYVPDLIKRQQANAAYYRSRFDDLCVPQPERAVSSEWLFPVFVKNRFELERRLSEHGIEARPGHYRNDTHTCVYSRSCHLPGMDLVQKTMTCIPCGWWVTDEDRERIADVLLKG
jgi:dTDP-4-amino-4,6-dideoxygalactose transaminase